MGILNPAEINTAKDVGGTLGNGTNHPPITVSSICYHNKQKHTCSVTLKRDGQGQGLSAFKRLLRVLIELIDSKSKVQLKSRRC